MEIRIPNPQDVEFEEQCWNCSGTGVFTSTAWTSPGQGKRKVAVETREPCAICDEKGYRLTPLGDRLLNFLDKYRPQTGGPAR